MSLVPHLNDLPKPDLLLLDQLSSCSSPNLTPSPHAKVKRTLARSAESSPQFTKIHVRLSKEDKTSMNILLSMFRAIESEVSRLYAFCEHNFSSDLTALVIEKLEEHTSIFKELQNQIESQEKVTEQLKSSQTPSSVSFCISPTIKCMSDEEEWPEATSQDWIALAEAHMRQQRPELSSPQRTSSFQQRLAQAEEKRRKLENTKKREIRMKTNKVRRVAELRVQQQEEAISNLNEKQSLAEKRREERIQKIRERAYNQKEKFQEMKFMQSLDTEDKKLQLERKQSEVSKRYENMVKTRSERARERSSVKSESPVSPRKQRSTILQAISQGRLPFSKPSEDIETPELVQLDEKGAQEYQVSSSLLDKIKREASVDSALKVLKLVMNQKRPILRSSECGVALRKTIVHTLGEKCSDQLIRQLKMMLPKSLAFVFSVVMECVTVFSKFCYKTDSLRTTIELLQLCTAIIDVKVDDEHLDNAKTQLIIHLAKGGVFDRPCITWFDSVVDNDFQGAQLKNLIQSMIGLIHAVALYLHSDSVISNELQECLEETICSVFYPGLVSCIGMCTAEVPLVDENLAAVVVKTLSLFVIDFPDLVEQFVDEQSSAALIKVMKQLITNNSVLTDDLIVLVGLICRWSETMRESCVWAPAPTLLSKLADRPLNYFIQKTEQTVLIPTLVACCIDSEVNQAYIQNTVNGLLIAKYLESTTTLPVTNDIRNPLMRIPKERIPEMITLFRKPQ